MSTVLSLLLHGSLKLSFCFVPICLLCNKTLQLMWVLDLWMAVDPTLPIGGFLATMIF